MQASERLQIDSLLGGRFNHTGTINLSREGEGAGLASSSRARWRIEEKIDW